MLSPKPRKFFFSKKVITNKSALNLELSSKDKPDFLRKYVIKKTPTSKLVK